MFTVCVPMCVDKHVCFHTYCVIYHLGEPLPVLFPHEECESLCVCEYDSVNVSECVNMFDECVSICACENVSVCM